MAQTSEISTTVVLTPEQLRQHWQDHRLLTRRVIDAFPDEALFSFSIGGMRPFAELAAEMLSVGVPTLRGIVTGEWESFSDRSVASKAELLQKWDAATEEIDRLWPTIPPGRFQEIDTAFGQWKGPGYELLWYALDNEIHHRGQGYVYLRALGIEPPPFYARGAWA